MPPYAARLCALSILLCPAAMASPPIGTWTSIPAESRLEFTAQYEGIDLIGEFTQFRVVLEFGDTGPAGLEVEVSTGSADMDDAEINDELRQPDWFDAISHPQARFRSREIRHQEHGRYLAVGTLQLKAVEHPVAVPFRWRSDDGRLLLQGGLELSRLDLGIGMGEWAGDVTIADRVVVQFDIALARSD